MALKPPAREMTAMGYRIKYEMFQARRFRLGISNIDEIAKEIQISTPIVRKLMNGQDQNPRFWTLVGVCRVLGLKLEDAIEWEEEGETQETTK